MKLADLKEIVRLFLGSNFLKTSDVFIITTTASLQEANIKKYIFEQIAFFRETYGIQFDCWDVTRLETVLKKQYLIVEHYFGSYEADRYCFQPAFRKIAYEAVPNFIERNLKDTSAEPELFSWMASEKKKKRLSLSKLFVLHEQRKRLIGIIAEAYEGKSTLFKQAAYELSQFPQTVPLFLDLKGSVIQPITNLLDIKFNTWRSIPAKDLIILIDGLDEVSTDDLLDAIGHIRDIAIQHPSIRVAISCRKLYYSNYNLPSELSQYSFYELVELHFGQIIQYADARTAGDGMVFYKEMESKGIDLLLSNPFYLTKLVGWYTDPKETIPETKVSIALKLVEESFNVSATRRIGKGKQLAHNKVRLKALLQQLALAFQINGTNSCDDDLMQSLFTAEDLTLLNHSSVLNIEKGKWMFTNAFFQEQLAAMALQKYAVEEIIGLITVGEHLKKIKTKWIQTIATYLSMFNNDDPDRQKLLEVIESDNIELIAKSEGSTFPPLFKLDVLRKIIKRTLVHQARLVLISENELAGFIGNENTAVDYILEIISGDYIDVTKEVCCHILKHIKLNQYQARAYTDAAKYQLVATRNQHIARLLLEAISHYQTGDREFLDELLKKTTLLSAHEFRQGVYKYLDSHGLIADYYDFVLDGLEVLYMYNREISHSGSEMRIKELMLKTEKPDQLRKLLKVISGDRFHSFFRFKKEETSELLEKLQDRLVVAYQKDPTILVSIVDCVVAFGLRRIDDELRGMNLFFEKTNTHLAALKIYLENPDQDRRTYDFSHYINPECFDYLIESHQNGLITRYELNSFANGLSYVGRNEEADLLQKMIRRKFGNPDPAITKKHARYAKAAMLKAENDVKYIASAKAFELGIQAFFKAFKKSSITLRELHNHEDRITKLINVFSDFISHLMHEVADDRHVSLQACLDFINDPVLFRAFRVKSLMDHRLGKKYDDQFLILLESYYNETVVTFDFKSVNNDSDYSVKILANQYLKIWAKYKFETPDAVLLEFIRMDGEGLNFIHTTEINRKNSVALALIAHFEERGKIDEFKQRILSNLKDGISNHAVLGTHIELCRHLYIPKACPYILKAIYQDFRPYSNEYGFMDVYAELGGDLSELLLMYEQIEDFEDYTFIHLTKLLSHRFAEKAEECLLKAFHSSEISTDKKREFSRYLAELGNKEGFEYIVAQLDPQKKSPYSIQSNWSVWNINTTLGLKLLEPLIFTLVDETLPKHRFHESIDHLLLELLRGFAGKSENDLQLVLNLLNKKSVEFETVYPNKFGQLLWYAQQMEETFRTVNTSEMPVSEMKLFLAKILN